MLRFWVLGVYAIWNAVAVSLFAIRCSCVDFCQVLGSGDSRWLVYHANKELGL